MKNSTECSIKEGKIHNSILSFRWIFPLKPLSEIPLNNLIVNNTGFISDCIVSCVRLSRPCNVLYTRTLKRVLILSLVLQHLVFCHADSCVPTVTMPLIFSRRIRSHAGGVSSWNTSSGLLSTSRWASRSRWSCVGWTLSFGRGEWIRAEPREGWRS